MYRYCVDNVVTYTSEDFVLFRESPFACWMERLTLENPDHGIPPDLGSKLPGNSMQRQDDLGETLAGEGKEVCIVDWDEQEPVRRNNTLEAMHRGVDFIVNGQLALGPLSGSANLLMKTSGYSELGSFLYIPCDTQAKTTMNSAFRLCFLADLLHSLQGQLPPQMLIIRGGSDLLPLQSEDHIYHYRAVKQRFMDTMRSFRKHRMPDPVDSSHFGRWSDCANEVLKQRMLRGDEAEPDIATREIENPLPLVASAVAAPGSQAAPAPAWSPINKGLAVSGTLLDQARMLHGEVAPAVQQSQRRSADVNNPAVQSGTHPLDRSDFAGSATIDRDEVTLRAALQSSLHTDSYEFEVDCIDDSDYQLPVEQTANLAMDKAGEAAEMPRPEKPLRPFSSSLNTSGADED